MIGLDAFKKILASKVALKPLSGSLIDRVQTDIRSWSVALSMKSETEQSRELEKLMSELVIAQLPDSERMDIMHSIYPIIERLIGQLHQHYIYEVSVISTRQQNCLNQVKSLYYLSILVYRGVIDRQLSINSSTRQSKNLLKFQFKKTTEFSQELQVAIYKACNIYLRLLMEQSTAYQKAPDLYWGELNFLYKIAFTKKFYDNDLHKLLAMNHSSTIQDVYRRACLHSLLGLSSYRRQDIIGVHKLLPEWAKQVQLTQGVSQNYKIFVDLNDVSPPLYLNMYSKINPYEAERFCLFLDLILFEEYLEQFISQSQSTDKTSIQLRLSKMALHMLHSKSERHEHRHVSYNTATIVSGFNVIHYYIANKKPLSRLVNRHTLQKSHIPKYDTVPKESHAKNNISVDVIDTSTTGCRFKWQVKQEGREDAIDGGNLQVLSLFAIQMHSTDNGTARKNQDGHWQLGIVRWVENHEDIIEAGARIIGYAATACGLRLDNKDTRSQDFVPALLLAGDDKLGSKTTLIIPHYHFRLNDKVILRIGDKQTLLRLNKLLIGSDDFEQYEMTRITS